MSQIGYYRYKTLADSEKTINWTVNFVNVASKDIVPVDSCNGDLIVKYLDKNGQYRFYPFNKYYETQDNPDEIGNINKFLTNIRTDMSSTKNVGYRNQRQIFANTDVPNEQLEKLTDIYTSPRVYLYIGDGSTDTSSDWLEVTINAQTPIVKRSRGNTGRIDITINLPEYYTTTMI
jgi:hypothetical protein